MSRTNSNELELFDTFHNSKVNQTYYILSIKVVLKTNISGSGRGLDFKYYSNTLVDRLTILRRSRSRSPSEGSSKTRLPEELKKHLEFELVETDGMTEEQLREIPYTAVKTSLKTNNSSPPLSSKRKTYSSRRAKRSVYKTVHVYDIA